MDSSLILLLIGAGLIIVFVVPYYLKHRSREKAIEDMYSTALDSGIDEPDTLHPVIDPNGCMCTGNCVAACPEKDVLGIFSGSALAIHPDRCVGHGLCERVCPVDAIQLVVGSSTRGVDIPRIKQNFETNVPGLFVIGELGGMGLIRNAFEQARQCVEGIASSLHSSQPDVLDVLIVGCGPAGLAATLNCKSRDLRFLTIEREDIGGTVRYYPRKKLVMTFPLQVPGYGKLKFKSIVKEDLIQLWDDIVEKTDIGPSIQTGESLVSASRNQKGYFDVETSKGQYRAQHIILAIGRRGTPRKLEIPGEEGSNVAYSLIDPAQYQQNTIMVVGGGDSAIECALALAGEPGNKVRLSYRKDRFSRIKPGNQELIEQAIAENKVEFLPSSALKSIDPKQVTYVDADDHSHTVANDYVFIMIGGTLPTGMLKELGVKIDTKFGAPLNK